MHKICVSVRFNSHGSILVFSRRLVRKWCRPWLCIERRTASRRTLAGVFRMEVGAFEVCHPSKISGSRTQRSCRDYSRPTIFESAVWESASAQRVVVRLKPWAGPRSWSTESPCAFTWLFGQVMEQSGACPLSVNVSATFIQSSRRLADAGERATFSISGISSFDCPPQFATRGTYGPGGESGNIGKPR